MQQPQTHETIYLNNAATSFPKPANVHKAVTAAIQGVPFHSQRTGFKEEHRDIIRSCREKIATLFNIKNPQQIVFTSGSTEALNLAILGMNSPGQYPNSHVITTAMEHNSVYRPLKRLEKEGKIQLSIVDCDNTGYVSAMDIGGAIRKNTTAIVVNHCSNVTGRVLDLKSIGETAHNCGALLIVDASQSAGAIPIDVEANEVDMLAFTGHKSLYGVTGTGGLYIKEGLKLEPLKTGGTGVKSELLLQPQDMPIYYEAGTPNTVGIAALDAGLDFIANTGIDTIGEKKTKSIRFIRENLDKNPNIILYGQKDPPYDSSLICFNIKNTDPADVGYMLEYSYDIIVRSGLHCAPLIHKALGSFPRGSIRISPSYFTTQKEIEKLVEALEQICIAEN